MIQQPALARLEQAAVSLTACKDRLIVLPCPQRADTYLAAVPWLFDPHLPEAVPGSRVSTTDPRHSQPLECAHCSGCAAAAGDSRQSCRSPEFATGVLPVVPVGAFDTIMTLNVTVGDKIAVVKDPANPGAGFIVAAVTQLAWVTAEGAYNPFVEMPYIVVDGVVVPL